LVRTPDYTKILKKLATSGDYADIFIESSFKRSIVFENGKIDALSSEDDAGVGLRLIRDGKTFYGFTNSSDFKTLEEIADRLTALAGETSTVNLNFMVQNPISTFERAIEEIPLKDKIKIAEDISKAAYGDKRIVQVRSFYSDLFRDIRIINSLGADRSKNLSYVTVYANAVAKDGDDLQTGYRSFGGIFGAEGFKNIDVELIGRDACRKAILNLEADYAPAGRMTAVLASRAGGTMVHEAVGHGLEADLAEEGMSVYEGKVGKQVASSIVSVIDDGTLKQKRGYIPFDDEGTDAARNVLIENGILKGYMRDRLYALKNGGAPTGNGRRESYRHKPIVRMTNTFIAAGTASPDEIIASVDNGIYVADMGGGQVNTVNGDFVFEVTEGYLIKNGKIDKPVKNATLMGNGPDVMQSIDMTGNDFDVFGIGTCGKGGQGVPVSDAQPTLRIPMITVGGK
jgi:TldD protein